MKHLALLIVLLAGLGVFVHFWSKASKERREVLARIDRERSIRPGYSPTAELFREVGAPPVNVEANGTSGPPPFAPPTPSMPPTASTAATTPASAATSAATPAATVAPPLARPPRATAAPDLPARDLPALFDSVAVPSDFVPVEPSTGARAVFAVERSAAAVRSDLDAVLNSAGLAPVWHEPTVATVVVGPASGLVTIYPNAGAVRDLDGRLLFPTARRDETVIRFSTS